MMNPCTEWNGRAEVEIAATTLLRRTLRGACYVRARGRWYKTLMDCTSSQKMDNILTLSTEADDTSFWCKADPPKIIINNFTMPKKGGTYFYKDLLLRQWCDRKYEVDSHQVIIISRTKFEFTMNIKKQKEKNIQVILSSWNWGKSW